MAVLAMRQPASPKEKDAATLTRRYTTTVCNITASEKTRTANAAVRYKLGAAQKYVRHFPG